MPTEELIKQATEKTLECIGGKVVFISLKLSAELSIPPQDVLEILTRGITELFLNERIIYKNSLKKGVCPKDNRSANSD